MKGPICFLKQIAMLGESEGIQQGKQGASGASKENPRHSETLSLPQAHLHVSFEAGDHLTLPRP